MSFFENFTDTAKSLVELLENTTSGAFSWNIDTDIVHWSAKLSSVLGHPAHQIEKLNDVKQIVHPDDHLLMDETLKASRKANSTYSVRIRIKNAEGNYQVFMNRGVWNKFEGDDILIGFLTDQTEIVEAEARARRAEALFRAFFDNVPAAVYIKDKSYRHIYGNQKAAEIAGVTLEEFLCKTTLELFDNQSLEGLIKTDNAVFKDREVLVWSGPTFSRSGSETYLFDTKFPIEDPYTGEIMLGGFGIDISAQRAAELALEKSRRLEAVGKLVSGVAHDFNNTLAIIQGNLELLEQIDSPEEKRELLDDALKALKSGAHLNRQLLTYARKAPLNRETVSLNRIVQEMDGMLRRTLPETIEIKTVAGDGLWHTNVDIAQVESAVINLALNARDAMPRGGKLILETSNVRLDPEHNDERHEQIKPGRYVMLAVTDTGTGMAPEVRERAFDPFFTTKEEGQGTGMGLAMVYGLMRQMDGAARIYSEGGIGTTFKLYFPALEQHSRERNIRVRSSVMEGTESILLVEDYEDLRKLLAKQVTSLGYHVTTAESGDAALALLKKGLKVDLILTDVVMPGKLMGPQLVQEAREILPRIPALFLSGYPAEALAHPSNLSSRDIVLLKPVLRDKLSHTIRQLLSDDDA